MHRISGGRRKNEPGEDDWPVRERGVRVSMVSVVVSRRSDGDGALPDGTLLRAVGENAAMVLGGVVVGVVEALTSPMYAMVGDGRREQVLSLGSHGRWA